MTTVSLHPNQSRIFAISPDLIELAGDGNAAIFLAQVLFWWKVKGRAKFYKFNSPCTHALYRDGDSWLEEVRLKRTMFTTARRRVAVKVRITCLDEIQAAFNEGAIVVYGTDEHHLTWYMVNETALQTRSPALYARLFGAEESTSDKRPCIEQSAISPHSASPRTVPQDEAVVTPQESYFPIPIDISQGSIPASAEIEPLQSPMQNADIGLRTEKTSEKSSKNNFSTQILATNIPLPTSVALEGEREAEKTKSQKVVLAIFTGLQERGVQEDPARLIARRAVQFGLGATETLEMFVAHLLDAERAGTTSPVGVAVSRMVKNRQFTPAPRWALAQVRRNQQQRKWEENRENLGEAGAKQMKGGDYHSEIEEQVDPKLSLRLLWQIVLDDIKLQVTRATFEQHFKGTWLEQNGKGYMVCSHDPSTREWLAHRLNRLVTEALQRSIGAEVSVRFGKC
jgi:hypothetical protein